MFTAERVAYRNLLEGVEPARAAVVGNPFREWIGAQIRTDAYGWAHPGDRTAAARLALVDARLSHTGAGVDGALWVAAMSAAALVLDDPVEAAVAGLEVISGRGAIARAVRFGLTLADAELDDALDALHAEYGDLHWVHAVNNTALTAYALTAPDFTTGDRSRGDGRLGHGLGRRDGGRCFWRDAGGSGRVVRTTGQPGDHKPPGDEPDRDRRAGEADCGGGQGWSLRLLSWVVRTWTWCCRCSGSRGRVRPSRCRVR